MGCSECERTRAAAAIDIQNLQADVMAKNRQIGKLKAELEEHIGRSPLSADINEICEAWRTKCGHPKAKTPLNGARALKVKARLGDKFTKDDLLQAVEGASKFPYVVNGRRSQAGESHERFDDLELICRNEKQVEGFMKLAGQRKESRYIASARMYWAELNRAGLDPTTPENPNSPEFKAFCPSCAGELTISPGPGNDLTDMVDVTCSKGCERSRIADKLSSRLDRSAILT